VPDIQYREVNPAEKSAVLIVSFRITVFNRKRLFDKDNHCVFKVIVGVRAYQNCVLVTKDRYFLKQPKAVCSRNLLIRLMRNSMVDRPFKQAIPIWAYFKSRIGGTLGNYPTALCENSLFLLMDKIKYTLVNYLLMMADGSCAMVSGHWILCEFTSIRKNQFLVFKLPTENSPLAIKMQNRKDFNSNGTVLIYYLKGYGKPVWYG